MKRPLFNEIQRQIMHEDKSLYAATMKLDIAIKRFQKELMKTFIGRLFNKSPVRSEAGHSPGEMTRKREIYLLNKRLRNLPVGSAEYDMLRADLLKKTIEFSAVYQR